MTRRTLAERFAAIEAKKAAIQQLEAKLRITQRKHRTRDLIAAGGLVEKAGLLDWPPNVLFGALLDIAGQDTPQSRQRWAKGGERAKEKADQPSAGVGE